MDKLALHIYKKKVYDDYCGKKDKYYYSNTHQMNVIDRLLEYEKHLLECV